LENRKFTINGDEIKLYSDPNKIKQIILNIFTNAFKFTDANNGKIAVQLEQCEGFVKIEVEDNGKGIPAQDLLYVFDRFYQASNVSKTNTEGTGLGLAICKHLIELLNGSISVKSTENEATTFTLKISDYKY